MTGVNIGVAAIDIDVLAAQSVPDLDQRIVSARGNPFAIGRPGHRVYIAIGIAVGKDILAGRDIPDRHGAI